MLIGQPGLEEEFIGSELGCSNPVNQLVQEAAREFGTRHTSCIVSLGTGIQGINATQKSSRFGLRNIFRWDLIKALKRMATDSEEQAREMKRRFNNCPGLYFRLNVARGLEYISLTDWDKMPEIKTHTAAYLEDEDVSREIDKIVLALTEPSPKCNVRQLGM
jgi:hypothetical protein